MQASYLKDIAAGLPTERMHVERRGTWQQVQAIPVDALNGLQALAWNRGGRLTAYAAVPDSGPWSPLSLSEDRAWQLAGPKGYVHTYTWNPLTDESRIDHSVRVNRGGVHVPSSMTPCNRFFPRIHADKFLHPKGEDFAE